MKNSAQIFGQISGQRFGEVKFIVLGCSENPDRCAVSGGGGLAFGDVSVEWGSVLGYSREKEKERKKEGM